MDVQTISTQPYEVTDFSGGITDYYLNCEPNKYHEADNFLLLKHGLTGKLFTRPGSEIYDSTYYQIPAGAQRIGTYSYFESSLLIHSARKLYYISAGWQTLQGPSSNDLFPAGVTVANTVSMTTWNHHLFITSDSFNKVAKVYKDGSSVLRLRTAGMPALATSPTVTRGAAGAMSLIYAFIYTYTYTVGSVVFKDRGPVTTVRLTSAADPAANAVTITNIPALANGATDNYDTGSANLKVEIYRTTDGGVNFFFVGSVNNGTTSTTDSAADAGLTSLEPLYTESGAPENDPPPLCKYVHVCNDTGYFAHAKEGSEVKTNRFYQSIPGDPDSVPEDFFSEVQDSIAGFSSHRNMPICLCDTFVYRIDGAYDTLGAGFIQPVKISDTAGCVSNLSIVQTPMGLFWAGIDGFYHTDGFQVTRISEGLDVSYALCVASAERKRRIVGRYDSKKNRVWWTVQESSSATDCDACWVLDLNFGLSTDMPFTTASGGANFAPTAIEFIGANLIRGDSRGYSFIHRDTLYTDPKVNVAAAPSTWQVATIIYDFISMATNFGTTMARKWVPRITVDCKNETNLSLQIISINDDGRKRGELQPIRFRGNITWGDTDVLWGDVDLLWDYQGLIDEQRRFPAQNLRCQYKQIELTNATVAIVNSEILGTATVSSGAKTVTLDNTVAFDWPTAAVDYYIAFSRDNYSKQFLITARTNDVLTFSDTDNLSVTGSYSWVIRGKPKGEVLHLLSYCMHFALLGKTSDQFRKSGTGEVGASDD